MLTKRMPQLSPSQVSHMGQNKCKSHTAELPCSIQIFFWNPISLQDQFQKALEKPSRTVQAIGGKALNCVPKACQ